MPEFEPPAFAPSDKANVSIVKIRVPCNWAQILEGAIDSAHSSSLHSTDIPPGRTEQTTATGGVWARPTTDKSPRIQVQLTNYGFRYAAIRRPIKNSQTHDYVRITAFVAPITVLIPPNNVYSLANVNVPEDDTHTTFYFIAWSDWGPGIDKEAFRKFCAARVGIDLDRNYKRIRTRENNYLQDRKAMKLGDYTGIPGIPNQDMAMWETMGPIADRTHERLGASDIAIVQFRRVMVDAVKRFANGEPAIGTTQPHIPVAKVKSFEGIVPKATNWRTLGASEEELAMYPKEIDPKEDIGVTQIGAARVKALTVRLEAHHANRGPSIPVKCGRRFAAAMIRNDAHWKFHAGGGDSRATDSRQARSRDPRHRDRGANERRRADPLLVLHQPVACRDHDQRRAQRDHRRHRDRDVAHRRDHAHLREIVSTPPSA